MTKKCPYSFPLRSRAAIVEFLNRDGRYYHYQRYRFVWNVKVYTADFGGDSLRKHDSTLDPALDAAWESYVEDDGLAFYRWCEDAGQGVADDEWTSWPGDDQGDWEFSFQGRSGGWLVLEKWRGRDLRGLDPADMMDPEQWPFDALKAFYRGIVCADSDFTPEKAAAAVEYMAADDRALWEEDRREEQDAVDSALAASIAADRPDLAPGYA